ncbi:hypothetical protein K8941_03040 [Buchnera aphidicola (Sitobion miscanthi)]|nr:hypothetical protein [Buchnera aphidicola]MCU4137298.1 hypothetical protein [Buchnera aphidicola (Sitobion miscanthi)]
MEHIFCFTAPTVVFTHVHDDAANYGSFLITRRLRRPKSVLCKCQP